LASGPEVVGVLAGAEVEGDDLGAVSAVIAAKKQSGVGVGKVRGEVIHGHDGGVWRDGGDELAEELVIGGVLVENGVVGEG